MLCHSCGRAAPVDMSAALDVGTFSAPALEVSCPFCQVAFEVKLPANTLLDQAEIRASGEDDESRVRLGNARDRFAAGDIYEKYVQSYFAECFAHYGFLSVEGPHSRGPDFTGTHPKYRSTVRIEIERRWYSYIAHGHDTDREFRSPIFLIALERQVPNGKWEHKLPKNRIHIDIEHFAEWWFRSLESGRFESVLRALAWELERLYATGCEDKHRDGAACPLCRTCPYFAPISAPEKMAAMFLIWAEMDPMTEDFRVSDVGREDLERFQLELLMGSLRGQEF